MKMLCLCTALSIFNGQQLQHLIQSALTSLIGALSWGKLSYSNGDDRGCLIRWGIYLQKGASHHVSHM